MILHARWIALYVSDVMAFLLKYPAAPARGTGVVTIKLDHHSIQEKPVTAIILKSITQIKIESCRPAKIHEASSVSVSLDLFKYQCLMYRILAKFIATLRQLGRSLCSTLLVSAPKVTRPYEQGNTRERGNMNSLARVSLHGA